MDAFKLILVSLAGWMDRQQQHVIESLQEEVRVMKRARPEEAGSQRLLRRRLINCTLIRGKEDGDVRCRERLGGMLRYYHREAA